MSYTALQAFEQFGAVYVNNLDDKHQTLPEFEPCIFESRATTGLNKPLGRAMKWRVSEYCFTSLSAQSWQNRDRRMPKAGNMPYSYFECLRGFFIVHNTIGSTVHSRPLNSLDHCICKTTMTNIRRDRDLNLVPPDYKPQSIRMFLGELDIVALISNRRIC